MGGLSERGGEFKGFIELEELKRIHGLEFITSVIETSGGFRMSLGFMKGRFIIFEDDGCSCKPEQIPIGESFYQRLKQQALEGKYDSAIEFLDALKSKTSY